LDDPAVLQPWDVFCGEAPGQQGRMANPATLAGEVVVGQAPVLGEPEGQIMDTILRCIGYAFDFIWMISPILILGLLTWRLAR
jgi:hypothetical protein